MQQTDAAIVAFATHDAEEADALCLLLGKAGWPTLRRRFTGGPDDAGLAANLANARCLIVLWSASTAPLQRLHFAAERAHRVGALIALRLDDGVLPVDTGAPLDFTGWPHQANLAVCEILLHAVTARLGPPPLRTTQSRNRAPPRRSPPPQNSAGQTDPATPPPIDAAQALRVLPVRRQRRRLMIGGLGAVAAAALGLTLIAHLDPDGIGATVRDAAATASWGLDDAVANLERGAAAAPDFGAAPSDPLRGFQTPHGSGLQSRAAARALAELEAQDWLQVRAANDAEHALAVLSRFRAAHPHGRNADAAAALEADWRALAHAAEVQLIRLGYSIIPSDGLLHPQTRASVRAFQSKLGIAPDGKIDKALLIALQSAAPEPSGTPSSTRPAQR